MPVETQTIYAAFTPQMNVSGFIAASNRLITLISDMSVGPMYRANVDAAGIYGQAMRDRFDSFSLGGGDWKPLAPTTIRAKRNSIGANLILVENGDMRASINRDNGNHFIQPLRDGLREGSMDPKIGWHQNGTRDGRLPARKIYITPDGMIVTQMARIGAVGIQESARESGFGIA